MRIEDQKVLFVCYTCNQRFYAEEGSFPQCPECNKPAEKFNNIQDRHREQCNKCEGIFEVNRKSPYENAHFLNCDSCMTSLKISYSDSILQKLISDTGLYEQEIGKLQIGSYWDIVEEQLINCLCGGEFKHQTSKKCPFCLEEISGIGSEYLIINDPKNKVIIPVITKHIWKSTPEQSRKNILADNPGEPLLQALSTYMKTLKYFQEIYYEKKNSWAVSIDELKTDKRVEDMVNLYSFQENARLLQTVFQFDFAVFPDNYHIIAFPLDKELKQAYLLQGKTGEIEIHPAL
jgi:hypothetical protein